MTEQEYQPVIRLIKPHQLNQIMGELYPSVMMAEYGPSSPYHMAYPAWIVSHLRDEDLYLCFSSKDLRNSAVKAAREYCLGETGTKGTFLELYLPPDKDELFRHEPEPLEIPQVVQLRRLLSTK